MTRLNRTALSVLFLFILLGARAPTAGAPVVGTSAVVAPQRPAEPSMSERDLRAQERMALSAEQQVGEVRLQTWWLALSFLFSAIATIVSVLALIFTLRTGRQELRAQLFPSKVVLLDGASTKPKNSQFIDRPGAHISIANTGQTPARDILSWADIKVLPVNQEHTLILLEPVRISPTFAPAHGGFEKTVNVPVKMTAAEKAGVKAGTHAIFVFGRITYRDAFNSRRRSDFRFKYSGPYPPQGAHTFWFCDNGNETN